MKRKSQQQSKIVYSIERDGKSMQNLNQIDVKFQATFFHPWALKKIEDGKSEKANSRSCF